jgi:thymidylate kinase
MGIRFCHWKSNIRLEDAISGKEDIDLLVSREDANGFLSALADAGFKRMGSWASIGHPGIFHALALDRASGCVLHLHVYFSLLGGDSLVKAYALPIGQMLLDNCREQHGLPTPDPNVELATFVLRVGLKHSGLVEGLLVNRDIGSVVQELAWLRAGADEAAAAAIFATFAPGLSGGMFEQLVDACGADGSLSRRIRLGSRIARAMVCRRRIGRVEALRSRIHRVLVLAAGRLSGRRDMVPETGGVIIALVGPKATGKSTLGDAIADRFGRHMRVVRIHSGKPPSTALSFGFRMLIPLARRLLPNERPAAYEKEARRSTRQFSLVYTIRMALLAYDRRALLLRSQRLAAKGCIVISDRYPSVTVGAIDSCCFGEDDIAACRSALKRRLMEAERRLHLGLPIPNLVIKLAVRKETAVTRDAERMKPEGPDASAVLRRWNSETVAEFPGTRIIEVSTDRDLDATIRDVVGACWAVL